MHHQFPSHDLDESDQIEEEKQQQEERSEEDVDDFEDDIQVETDDAFTQGTQDLNDIASNHIDNIYCEVPDVNLDNVIVSNQEIKDTLKDYWAEQLKPMTFPSHDQKLSEHKHLQTCGFQIL